MSELVKQADVRFEKVPCSKCGELSYRLLYIGARCVCLDCFKAECDKREAVK